MGSHGKEKRGGVDMRVIVKGRVVDSRKNKPDSKMYATQLLQTGGMRAELVEVYTPEMATIGKDLELEVNIRMSEWVDKRGIKRSQLMMMQVEAEQVAAGPNSAMPQMKKAV